MFGVWLGVDVGTVRVGVARCDPHGMLATPLTTLNRDEKGNSDIAALVDLVAEHEAVGVVIGLPRTLAGAEGTSAQMARGYADLVAVAIRPLPVELSDERLSTTSAQRKLIQAGRNTRKSRAVIDQAAAVVILQHWLDSASTRERLSERPN
ncbi:putative Holliday junction resolvase [Jatrophihabitans sp. GAS493]|uniref:Holliday junction resolvase RuvX n=1 Tax=Jatrophihabitans sp. GAS493 TaxID=1907575 RepID=UPI000BB8B516|nr:Holliday junction resolvase RuvX [Jatrophihabitans sp. GAS493]SOD74248.1 putative Holliday junction resolvase [Jatrophihabitans sp. GAS493]